MLSVVKVITCGFPPLEDRDKSLKSLAGHDFFGCGILTKEETVSYKFPLLWLRIEKAFLVKKIWSFFDHVNTFEFIKFPIHFP